MCDIRNTERVESPMKIGTHSRKITKPLMEKRRRARINDCLTQLKSILLDAMKRDSTQFSKLEKADILEMTVAYLRNLQQRQVSNAMVTDASVGGKYRSGFTQCASEVCRYLGSVQGIDDDLKYRLEGHLTRCVQTVSSKCKENPNPVRQIVHAQPICVQIPDRVSPVPKTCYGAQLLIPAPIVGVNTHSEDIIYGQQQTIQASDENLLPNLNILSESSKPNILTRSKPQFHFSQHNSSSENNLPFPFAKPVQNSSLQYPNSQLFNPDVVKTENMWRPW